MKKKCLLILLILFSIFSVSMLTGFDIDNRGMVCVNNEDATMAGVFVTEGPLDLESCDGIHCLELRDFSENYFHKEKYSYGKPGSKRYAYIRVDDGYFRENLNTEDFFTVKCADEGETIEGVDKDGNALKVNVLKLTDEENLSKSGIFGESSIHLNASGYVNKFVEDFDFLKGSFDMGIYEFKVLFSSNEEFTGKKILILCPKDFAAYLEENGLGLNLRGVRCYDGMENHGNQLWSIVSASTLDYDNISVETKEDLMKWYGGALAGETDDFRMSGPLLVVGIIALMAIGEGGVLIVRKVIVKKKKR